MKHQTSLLLLSLLVATPGFAIGKSPITTGLRCKINVLGADGSEKPSQIDLSGVSPSRQLTSLTVNHAGTALILVGPADKLSFPTYVVANQINNIHQTKTLIVDSTTKDADGKKAENINLKFKLKVKYGEDATAGSVSYAGSILYSFPDGKGDTLDASGPVKCTCTDKSGSEVACVKDPNAAPGGESE